MKTDELIGMLSTGISPVRYSTSLWHFAAAVAATVAGALVLMLTIFGLRPDLSAISTTPLFWGKVAFPMVLAAGAWLITLRLSRPGSRMGLTWLALALPVLVVWIAAALWLNHTQPENWQAMLLGQSWKTCPFNILLLSVPGFIIIFKTMRTLAPTHLRLAGAASGLLAGAMATVVYCLHCPEMSPAFWGIWYLLGMLLPTGAGALLGQRLLRW